jgi:hypothetical protein
LPLVTCVFHTVSIPTALAIAQRRAIVANAQRALYAIATRLPKQQVPHLNSFQGTNLRLAGHIRVIANANSVGSTGLVMCS